jgi:hypothetical protein
MAGMMNLFMGHYEEPHVALHLFVAVPHGLYAEIFPDPSRDPMWFELALRAAAHQVWANNVCSAEPSHLRKVQRAPQLLLLEVSDRVPGRGVAE